MLFRALGVVLAASIVALPGLAAPVGLGEAGPLGVVVTTPLEEVAVLPGGVVPLPVRFEMPPGVHLYWHNPGEAGMPPRVLFEAPPGWEGGEADGTLHMPPPIRFEAAGIVGFGYEESLLIEGTGRVSASLPAGESGVAQVRVRYLACDADRCVPGDVRFTLRVRQPEATEAATSMQGEVLAGYASAAVEGRVAEVTPVDGFLPLPGVPEGAVDVGFFPFPEGMVPSAGGASPRPLLEVPEAQRDGAGGWRVPIGDLLDPPADGSVLQTGGVVAYTLDGSREGFTILGRSR